MSLPTSQPYRPSHRERVLYYYGLPSRPRLVARSSSDVWQDLGDTGDWQEKSLGPVLGHPSLHRQWNDSTSSLRRGIMEALETIDWTAVEIMRIGPSGTTSPITLLVSVLPDSLSWERGCQVALRCKAVLEAHAMPDIHCEIRESRVSLLTSPPSSLEPVASPDPVASADPSPSHAFRLSSEPITEPFEDILANLSDCIGTSISMRHMPERGGTKGLYLAVSSPSTAESKVMVLTCRHVAIDNSEEGLDTYRYPGDGPSRDVIQVTQPLFRELQSDMVMSSTPLARKKGDSDQGDDVERVQTAENLLQTLQSLQDPSSRTIGRLLYAPTYALEETGHDSNWLRDWALIELTPARHMANLVSLRNKVFVGTERAYRFHVDKLRSGLHGLPLTTMPDIQDCTVELGREVLTAEEIRSPRHISQRTDEPAMVVMKQGARTGLTIGIGHTLKSVTRHESFGEGRGSSTVASEEWAITNAQRVYYRYTLGHQLSFSADGDSGACVWDAESQRPAGMIVAGNNTNGVADVTYAQPLERLLADIKAHGFDVSLV